MGWANDFNDYKPNKTCAKQPSEDKYSRSY